MKPAMKQHIKESDHFLDNPEEIPVALEEVMLRKKIQLEQDLEKERKRAEKKERMLELQAQVMVNSMVPDKSTISIQTEDPLLRSQGRVLSLEIAPREVVLPTLKPPSVYVAEDQKHRFISRLMTDPEKAATMKNPIKVGMTFKQQLA